MSSTSVWKSSKVTWAYECWDKVLGGGRVEVMWPGWISISKALKQGWPFDGPAAAIHPPVYIEMLQQKRGGDGCGEMGLWACAVGCEWKAKAYLNTREPVVASALAHPYKQLYFVFPQCAVGQYTSHKGSKHPFWPVHAFSPLSYFLFLQQGRWL